MRTRTFLLAVLLCGFPASALPADPQEIERNVAELNAQSVKLLGVSLNALRYLVSADPNSYLLLSHLERTGDMSFIREPDGTEQHEKFLRVIPAGAGVELQRCMLVLR